MDYKVRLEVFEGPLDLLLHLVKKEEMDIYRIPITRITAQYMEYLDLMKMVIPDVAGEFIVMGATLMYIKSRMLLPEDRQVLDPEAPADELDPRWDLIRQLVEYKKFKDAAEQLQQREAFQENVYTRQQATLGFDLPAEPTHEKGEASIFDLLNAFNKILKKANEADDLREIFEDRYSVSDKIDFILRLVSMEQNTQFSRLFEGAASRTEIVVTFLAILELIRLKQICVLQPENFGEIEIKRAAPEVPPAASPENDPAMPAAGAATQQDPG